VGIDQPFFDRPPEYRAVRNLLAELMVIDISMGINVHHCHRAVFLVDRPKYGQRDCVISANANGLGTAIEHIIVKVLDDVDGL
jgi:hypothetical protein